MDFHLALRYRSIVGALMVLCSATLPFASIRVR